MGTRVLGLLQSHEKILEPIKETVEEELGRQLSGLAFQRLNDYQSRKAAEQTDDPNYCIGQDVADFMKTVPINAPEYEILSKVLGIQNGALQLQGTSSSLPEVPSYQVNERCVLLLLESLKVHLIQWDCSGDQSGAEPTCKHVPIGNE